MPGCLDGLELVSFPRYGTGTLARYDAAADEWLDVRTPAFDGGRLIWTGTHVLLIADRDTPTYLYNPATEIWLEASWPNCREDDDLVSVWAGDVLVEWGGWEAGDGSQPTDGGWVLRPDLRRVEPKPDDVPDQVEARSA